MTSAVGVLVGLVVGTLGCRGGVEVNEERGAGHVPTTVTPAAPAPSGRIRHSAPSPRTPAEETVTVVETPIEAEAPEIDLELRVRNAYGYPADCLGPRAVPEGVTQFVIRLSVSLTPTGTVTRATATAPAVSATAQSCLQARADRMRVAGPIPDAPRTVTTQLEMRAVAPQAARDPQTPPDRELPTGAQAPGTVLPAVAGDGPAPGYVAPGETLPAVVGSGPAEGSRPADRALPARGGSGTWMWIGSSAEARGDVADNWDDD